MRSSAIAVTSFLLAATACGDEQSQEGGTDVGPNGGVSIDPGQIGEPASFPESDEAVVIQAHGLAGTLLGEAEQALSLALDAAAFASNQTGRLTLVGRVRQQSAGARAFTYEATGGSSLIVQLYDESGQLVETTITFENLQGQGSTATDFLGGDHGIRLRMATAGLFDWTLSSRRTGTQVAGTIKGLRVLQGRSLTVDLSSSGTRRGEVDSTGSSSATELTTKGVVTGDGYRMNLSEAFEAETVTAGRDSASASTSRLAHTVDVGGRVYRYDDVIVRRNFRDGEPTETDTFWMAQGDILREGWGPVASYILDAMVTDRFKMQGLVLVKVRTPRGEAIIETWQKS